MASMLASDPDSSWFRIAKACLISSTRPALTSVPAPFSMMRRFPLPARRSFAWIGEIEAVAALLRDILGARRDGEGPRLVEPSVWQHQNADDVVFEYEDMGRVALVAGERQVARLVRGQREPRGRCQRHQAAPLVGSARMWAPFVICVYIVLPAR
jgi:hypothetical protein